MKNYFIKFIAVIILVLSVLSTSSCFKEKDEDKTKYLIVCTAFPQYDFVKEIIKGNEEKFDVVYLFDNGADVHSFETDIGFKVKIQIMESDMFIYNGGESDSWVKNIIEDESMNKTCKKISLVDSVKKDLLINTSHQSHGHEEEASENNHENTNSVDEHVWLSITNAIDICEVIYNEISSMDESHKKIYEKNFESYCDKLLSLHSEAINAFSEFSLRYVIFADRFPFAYFFRDYGIKCTSAFSGCTAETEATYENVIKLCKEIESNNLSSVLVLEKSTSNVASSIISSVKREIHIYTLNSLQSVSREDIQSGCTYYNAMKNNIEALKKSMS